MDRIYCVEDDESIRELVLYALNNSGFEGVGFADGAAFWPAVDRELPRLVLLDLMLPEESGMEILRRLRENPRTAQVPVILLTAKTAEYDRVRGLDAGADDYVPKPFGVMELLSRIRAVLRRAGPPAEKVLTVGPISLDPERRRVTVEGQEATLTFKEFELLRYLMKNCGLVLSREKLMEAVWGFDFEGESRTVDMHIKSLRQKLGDAGRLLQTVRGVGYRLDERGE